MAGNITPPGVRCDDVSVFCPAVYRLSDGRTAYQGPPLGPEELAAEVRARFGDGDAALELYRRAGICP